MKKIPTIFVRDENDRHHVTGEITPGCEWVFDGEGTASYKWDGTCIMLDENGNWWARREVKPGKAEPQNWREVDNDQITHKRMGWEPIEQASHYKAFQEATKAVTVPWTYELVGPKVNGNPHGLDRHSVVPHGAHILDDVPRTYDGLNSFLRELSQRETYVEGIVFRHPDGRMAKIKTRDFPAPEDEQ